jgi:hypothetical protein
MVTRDQLTDERLDALIAVLEADAVISPEYAKALKGTRELGHGREIAKAARENRSPPDFAGGNQ